MIGSLEIGFSVGIGNTGLAEKIQAFNEKYPNIAMKFTNQSPSMLLKMLKNGDLDLVLMPMFEERYYQNVEVRRLSTERMSAVFPRTHVLAQKPYVTRADLKDENLILACTPESEIGEDKRIIETFWKRGYHPNVVAKIEDVETILLMLSANMGVTILPSYLSIPLQSRGRLVSVPFGGPEDTIDIIAAWMPQTENPSLEKILPFLEENQYKRKSQRERSWVRAKRKPDWKIILLSKIRKKCALGIPQAAVRQQRQRQRPVCCLSGKNFRL